MAQVLAAGLEAAQRRDERAPVVTATVRPRIIGGQRAEFPTQWYDGAEPAGVHGAYVTQAIPLLTRIRVDSGALKHAGTGVGPGETFSTWSTIVASDVLTACIAGNGLNVDIYYVKASAATEIYMSASSNGGLSFGAFSLVKTHSAAIAYIAAAVTSGGDRLIVVNTGANLSAYKDTGAGFGAAVTSTDGTITVTGIALNLFSDFDVVVTGTRASDSAAVVATRIFGLGVWQALNTWSTPATMIESASGTGVTYSYPGLGRPDIYRAAFRESYSGTGAYNRIMFTHVTRTAVFVDNRWREPYASDFDNAFGLAFSRPTDGFILSSASDVIRFPFDTAEVIIPDSRIVTLNYPTAPMSAQTAELWIDNSDDAYTAYGSGALLALRTGAQVDIELGITIAGTPTQQQTVPSAWISALTHRARNNRRYLVIELLTAFAACARFRSPRSRSYTGTTTFAILAAELALAGIDMSSFSTSSGIINVQPEITINPGTSTLSTLRRLLARHDDIIMQRTETIYIRNANAADVADWNFGFRVAAQHPIGDEYTYTDVLPEAPHVRVVGGDSANIIGESLNAAAILAAPGAILLIADRDATTAALATARAEGRSHALDRREAPIPAPPPDTEQVAASPPSLTIDAEGSFTSPVHHGLELGDVLSITDARAGLSSALYRVIACRIVLDRRTATSPYNHHIELGAR